MMKPDAEVILYTDGACRGNPGPGGWAYLLIHRASKTAKKASGGDPRTTNNKMELTAVIQGLSALKRPTAVRVMTDSEYVSKGMNEWVAKWQRDGWHRGVGRKKEPVKNVELWKRLVELCDRHQVRFEHVFGHAGHPENEECDRLAVAAAQEAARGRP